MREETEREFREILERHDREILRPATPGAEDALRQQEFDRAFAEHAKDVIEPVMTKLRAMMRDHDLRAEVVVTQRHGEGRGKVVPSSIAFEFHVLTDLETHGLAASTPALTFLSDPAAGSVVVHEHSSLPFLGGYSGVVGRYALGALTAEVVEKHLLDMARKVLLGTGVT
jgi:hypothetical protein